MSEAKLPQRLRLDSAAPDEVLIEDGSCYAFRVDTTLSSPKDRDALAAEIVRRWNAHSRLLAALEAFVVAEREIAWLASDQDPAQLERFHKAKTDAYELLSEIGK